MSHPIGLPIDLSGGSINRAQCMQAQLLGLLTV